ncbi:hypothetical protein CHISP_0926 [Chitinispirillum alkaliphilum]|nr:hypothetical protein CHISP_0926 [Chitinispirillum alkaliphilum]
MCKLIHIYITAWFFSLVLLQNCWASCVVEIIAIRLDTISIQPDLQVLKSTGNFIIGTEPPPGDTIRRSEMLEKLMDRYNSHENVYIATVDSCALDYSYETIVHICLEDDPDCDPFESVNKDSIFVHIETVLKPEDGRIHDGYRFSIIQFNAKSYTSLCGNRVLGFSNDMSDDLSMLEGNVGHRGICPPSPRWYTQSMETIENIFIPPDAFFLNDNDEIIHKDYIGVSVPLEMFLTAIEETASLTKCIKTKRSFSGRVQSMPNGSLKFSLPDTKANGTIRIAAYNLIGKRVGQWFGELNDGSFVLSPEQMSLPAGYYRFDVNDTGRGDTMHSFGHLIVR